MKKFLCILTALLTVSSCDRYNHDALEDKISDLKSRVAALEEWAETVNSNIVALQDIIAVLLNNDYVTGVTAFDLPAPGGYVISFLKSGSIIISNGVDGTDGKNGSDGRNGNSPQISVKQDTDGVYYWTLNGEWIIAGGNKLRVTGEKGADGSNGQDGITPKLRINSATNMWEISYDEGNTWTSLEVAATGADGQNGQNGITPQLHINSVTNIWEISYDGGDTWTSLEIAATGDGGEDGQAGVTPQLRINSSNIWEISHDGGNTWNSLGVAATGNAGQDGQTGQTGQNGVAPTVRINTDTNEWEISSDNGDSWETTGIQATGNRGDKGDMGDVVFATNGVDDSNADYVEFTLADGVTKIKVPKYKKTGLTYTQPGVFAAGETKLIEYTPEGNVAAVRFADIPAGWKASVDQIANAFTVTAPAIFNDSNKGGEAIILVSDNDRNMIMYTVNFRSNVPL
jgi:hypothetical protein